MNTLMNRRDALKTTAALLGTTIVGAQAFLSGCSSPEQKIDGFNNDIIVLLDEIGETILPETTSSPGAKAAKIGDFMKKIVTDCYDDDEQKIFFEGLTRLETSVEEKYNKNFLKLDPQDRIGLLTEFDKESRTPSADGKEHFFNMLNQLTVWGFFSSEPGATKALRYVPIPGRYEGCIPLVKGQGAWVY
jgi:hypothetical protein